MLSHPMRQFTYDMTPVGIWSQCPEMPTNKQLAGQGVRDILHPALARFWLMMLSRTELGVKPVCVLSCLVLRRQLPAWSRSRFTVALCGCSFR